jgi:hypothetical protein
VAQVLPSGLEEAPPSQEAAARPGDAQLRGHKEGRRDRERTEIYASTQSRRITAFSCVARRRQVQAAAEQRKQETGGGTEHARGHGI